MSESEVYVEPEPDDAPYNIRSMFSEKPDAPPFAPSQSPIGIISPRSTSAAMSIPDMIRAAMKPRMIDQRYLAREMRISESYLSAILIGKRSISVYVALQLERVFGTETIDAEQLLIRQVKKELAAARKEMSR